MKRYWLFQFDEYYPRGGINDFVESFDSIQDALECSKKVKNEFGGESYHIFDSEKNEIIETGIYEI